MISILIPVYNTEKYLNNCIESVINQTYRKFEVILINDGSTDDSGLLCQHWQNKDSRIKYFEKPNEGIGLTRNFAIKMASQPYITFLDADDWWDENYLAEMLQPVIEQKADMVVCDLYYVTKDIHDNLVYEMSEIRLPVGIVVNAQWDKSVIHRIRTFSYGKVFLKSLFIKDQMYADFFAFEDIPIMTMLGVKAKRIVRVGKPLYHYNRFRPNSTSNNEKYYSEMGKSLCYTIGNMMQKGFFAAFQSELMRLVYSQIKFILKKVKCNNTNDAQTLQYSLFAYWREVFKDTPILDEYTYGIWGEVGLKKAACNLLIDENNILWHEEKGEFLPPMSLPHIIIADMKFQNNLCCQFVPSKIVWIDMMAFVQFAGSIRVWEISDVIFFSIMTS